MKKSHIILLFFIFSCKLFAQKIAINGYVSDASTGEALIGATIFEENSKIGSFTNKYGYFVLALPQKNVKIRVSFIGYESSVFDFVLKRDTTITISLSSEVKILAEVVIKEKQEQKLQKMQIGVTSIPISRLKAIPILFGESDIIKALTMTPGVSMGNEGTAGLLVRGGTPDQNLILLDDATVYNTAHLFGLVSVFNTDAIKNVDLYKGGFPARFGGRLSSVLDISMKEGNNQKKNREFTVGLIGSKLLLEGPLSDKTWGKSSYMISVRTSYLTPFLLPQIISFKRGNADQSFNYWLYDINGKVNHKINDKAQVFASFYHGNDFWVANDGLGNDRSKFNLAWGNIIGTARFNYIIHPKLFLKTIGSFSKYKYEVGTTSYEKEGNKWQKSSYLFSKSSIGDFTAKASFEWFPFAFQQVRFGFEATNHQYSPTQLRTSLPILADSLKNINSSVFANEYSAFVENEMDVTKWFKVNLGIRTVLFKTKDKDFNALEPRITANIILPFNIALKGGYAQMNQLIHLLNSNSVGLPNDVWVPVTKNVNPSYSEQLSFGLTKSFPKQHLELTVEVYQKSLENLIDYSDGKNFFSSFNTSWENLIEKNGVGRIKGFEAFLNKTEGAFTGWIAYTLATNERKFENINKGTWFAANYDRRHSIAITANYAAENSRKSFSVSWVYQSGQPITVPVAIYEQFNEGQSIITGFPRQIYEGRNNYRMPAYHRLDFSYSVKEATRRHREGMWTLGIYNVYNHVNPYYLDLKAQPFPKSISYEKIKGVESKLYKVGIIPFLPFVSYSIKLK